MSGSGVRIGLDVMKQAKRWTPEDPDQELIKCAGEEAGTGSDIDAAVQTGPLATPPAGMKPPVFDSSERLNNFHAKPPQYDLPDLPCTPLRETRGFLQVHQ